MDLPLKANEAAAEKFWAKVARRGKGECWLWMGAKKPSGYGNVRISKKYLIAHRVAWELAFGPIPAGMQIQHSCDNPSCCNPNHLMLGTVISNYIDMVRKGRGRSNHSNRRRGERHHGAKLTSEQVDEIRRRYRPGRIKQKDLADEYGVTQPEISAIHLRKIRNYG